MTTDTIPNTDRTAALLERVAACTPVLAQHAARHDAEGSWVSESFECLRDAGLLAIGVPEELGGDGATIREIALVQRELAKYCGSTALATSMHQHVTAFTAWRYRRGLPGAEATLRRIANEHIVLVSTGGADFTHPRGTATKVEGGYRVSGDKVFASQSVAGTVMSTMFAYDDPDRGRRVLNMAVPISGEGVEVMSNWNTLGMRGTASNDIRLRDVFVPDERVLADRPYGVLDGPLQVILSVAIPIITAVYLGIAEGARDHAIAAALSKADDPTVQRQIGLMNSRLRVAGWALDGALTAIGDDPQPSMDGVAAIMAAKREVLLTGIDVCDIAMDLGGGGAFFKSSPIERAYRDIRAGKFHPLTPELSLLHAGRHALGLPCDEV